MPRNQFIDDFRAAAPKSRPQARPVRPVRRPAASHFPDVGVTLRSYAYDPLSSQRPATAATVVKRGRWQRLKRKLHLKQAAISLVIIVVLVGGYVGGKFLYNAHKIFGGSLFGLFSTTKLKGEDVGRVNILLTGNSADDPGHDGANLTDSIMVLSLDTKNHTAFMLSLPRDLWVDIPGAGHQKLNYAYVAGQTERFRANGYPHGGMGVLEQIIQQDFGIPIDYYALINYSALKDAVNAVGGITVNIHSDDPRGLYDPSIDYATNGPLVKLTNGQHVLNGEQALDLARARGDAYGSYGFIASDFERTQNQRMMLVALKNKIFTTSVLANPGKLSSLADAIGNHVKTDFKTSEVHRLYDLVKATNNSGIQSLSLNDADGKNLLKNYDLPGVSALAPAAGVDNYTDIQAFLQRQLSDNPVVRESAQLVVLNATATDGLAAQQRQRLTNNHLLVAAIGDATKNRSITEIIDVSNGKDPATRKLLKKLYGDHFTPTNPYAGVYNADFIVLIGADQVPAKTTSQ
ncbi:MAG TPA: LCP family protein [Candidatus Saccharimonadales bacterium]|nr:LCP family protein [Candidatus Saccharimonadales bacterium]